jgi:hypothetical protein
VRLLGGGGLTTLAQTIEGIKTFASKIVAAAGIEITSGIWSTLGAGASDVCMRLGSTQPAASVHGSAKLVAISSEVGGTPTDSLAIKKSGTVDAPGGTLRLESGGTGIAELTASAGIRPLLNAYYAVYFATAVGGIGTSTAFRITTERLDASTAVAVQINTLQSWVDPAARLLSASVSGVEKAAIAIGGIHPPKLSAAPAAPAEGQTYYNTTDHMLYTWDGTTWRSHW